MRFVVVEIISLINKTQSSPNSNTWSPAWTSLGGGLRANRYPIGIANDDGRLQVFVVGTNNHCTTEHSPHLTAIPGLQHGFLWVGGIKAHTSPTVARNSDGRLQVFVVGTNNQLQYRAKQTGSSTWSPAWTSLGGGLRANTDPIGIANNDGTLRCLL